MSVRKKMAHGMVWNLLGNSGQQIINFVVFLIVAHLIGPEEFGLAGLCAVFSLFALFVVFGSVDAVVSQRLTDDRSLSTLFWPVMVVGASLSLITYLSAGSFAAVMREDRLEGMLRALAILPFLFATSAVPIFLIQARMEFRALTFLNLISTVLGGAVGVIYALKGYGAYALVYQQVTQYAVGNLLIWPCARWRPRLIMDRSLLSQVLSPGLQMIGSNLISFIDVQFPRLIFGLFLGPLQVGYYALAFRLFATLREVLVSPITNIFYPALAQIVGDSENVRRLFGQIIFLTGIMVLPSIAGAVATAPLYVPLFFGEEWTPATPFLQIFLVAMTPTPFFLIARELLRANRKTGVYAKAQLMVAILNVLAVLLLIKHGITVVAIGMTVVSFVCLPIAIAITASTTRLNLGAEFLPLGAAVLACAIMVGGIYLLQHSRMKPDNQWLNLLVTIIVGIVLYATTLGIVQFRRLQMVSVQVYGLIKQKRSQAI